MTRRPRRMRQGRKGIGFSAFLKNPSAAAFDRRWPLAVPAAFAVAAGVGFNSFAHVSKSAGACPIVHPAFCSTRALQAPVTRDLGRDGKIDDRMQAARLASAAVDLVPINPAAIRNLALASISDEKALKLMRLSDRLSRRDGVTEAWLIQEAARRGDLSSTMTHFDALLRTLPAASSRYMQQMGVALGDRRFRKKMLDYARQDNPWFGSLGRAIMSSARPIRFYGQYLVEVPSLPDTAQQRLHYDEVLSRLAREGQYDIVRRLYLRLPNADRAAVTSAQLPGGQQTPYRPVTWWLQSDGAAGAEMARDAKPELIVYAESGASGTVASKLLFLTPGRYRLNWRIAGEEASESGLSPVAEVMAEKPGVGDGLSWTINCPAMQGREVISAPAEPAGAKGRIVGATFDIPAGCTVQNLALQARIDSSASGVQWMLSDIAVGPVAARDLDSARQ